MNKKIPIYIMMFCIAVVFLFIVNFAIVKEQEIFDQKQYLSALEDFNTTQSNHKHNIGILSIALGRYNVLWKDFYESCEKYFFPGQNKQYFLFTDDINIPYGDAPNVHVIYIKNLEWPYHALLRYHIFLTQKEKLSKLDYIFYFNMDLIFRDFVGEEVLPGDKNDGLVFVHHCARYRHPFEFPYERDPKSVAYVPFGKEGKYYVPGGINGGRTKEFLEFCEYCRKNIRKDLANKFITRWHDEAYTNKYIIDKNPLILPVNYMYPEWCKVTEYRANLKAEIRDKQQYGGRTYLRGKSNIKSTKFTQLKYKFLSLFSKSPKYKKIYEELNY